MQKITIPRPCHEDWAGMTAQKDGRFCGSCQKTVIDFTAKTDAEILAFFVAKADEKDVKGVCGRFKTDQLARELHKKPYILPLPQQNTGYWRNNQKRLAQASLLASVLYTLLIRSAMALNWPASSSPPLLFQSNFTR